MKDKTYVAFLRGINVGGHHKVPMADLKVEFTNLGYSNIVTLLNSGNVIFSADSDNMKKIESSLSDHLEKKFGFPIPTIVRHSETIFKLIKSNPFENVEVTKEIRLYISFLKEKTETSLSFPWKSGDQSYSIIDNIDNSIISYLDLSKNNTPKAMDALEQFFGKSITTRNWNTILKINAKLNK